MCGRYAASRNPEDLVEEVVAAGLPVQRVRREDVEPLRPSFNVAPTAPVAALLPPRRGDEAADGGAAARLRAMRWGLVPSWAKDVKVGSRMINARVETVLEKPAFRSLVGSRRCLLPADGWYEWQTVPPERTGGAARKQPFFMSAPREALLAIAGLHTWWRDPAVADDDPAAWVGSVTVLTTAAEPGLQAVHDRMPVVLQPALWPDWLSPDVPAQQALDLAVGQPAGRFTARPVGTGVGNVRNDSPGLLDPVPLGALQGVVDPATGELYA